MIFFMNKGNKMKKKNSKNKASQRNVKILLFLLLAIGIYFLCTTGMKEEIPNIIVSQTQKKPQEKDLLLLVNKDNPLPENYQVNLITIKGAKIADWIAEDFKRMIEDAKKEKVSLTVNNSYRSKQEQQKILDNRIKKYQKGNMSKSVATQKARTEVQLPGYSEHETGLAIDFSKSGDYDANTLMWKWLDKNAYKYGFIKRYPVEKQKITGVVNEPWHYRYVGINYAKEITENNLCLEEYIKGREN